MALAIYLKELLKALELNLETYLKKHYELFEAVDTGYTAKDGRQQLTELIYHGHSSHVCRYCRRGLKKKTMRLVVKEGRNHVVNGLSKEMEDTEGNLCCPPLRDAGCATACLRWPRPFYIYLKTMNWIKSP